jgi:hypothetical protein
MLINLVLLVAVLFVGNAVFTEWQSYETQNNVARIRVNKAPPAKGATTNSLPATQSSYHLQPAGNYNVLFEKNLFSPNRREIEPPEPVADNTPKIPPMQGTPIMTGVSLIGDKRVAYVQEPGQQIKTFQVGDAIMGFGRVTEIRNDGMVFTWGEMTHNISINERAASVRGPVVGRLAATVIKVGSSKKGGAPASLPPSSATGAPAGPSIQVSTVGSGAGPAGAGVAPQLGNASGAARPGMARGSNSQVGQQGIYPNQGITNQSPQPNAGYLDTPFGRIPRPQRRNQ